MSQQNINPGTFVDDPTAETTFSGFTKTQANFTDLYSQLAVLGDTRFLERPISLVGTTGTEMEQVAEAVNNKNPGVTIPLGYVGVFAYFKSYSPAPSTPGGGPVNTYFTKDYYFLKTGSGFYGVHTLGETPTVVNSFSFIKGGTITQEPATTNDLGEIGTTPIQTAVNSSGTPLIVAGTTIFNLTRSGVEEQYVFYGDDGTYGSGNLQTSAANFIDTNEDSSINKKVNERAKIPIVTGSDINVTAENLFRVNRLTQNDAIVNIQDDGTEFLEGGSWGELSFGGTGTHTVNYPTTDGASVLNLSQGGFALFRKIDANTWIVKEVEAGSSPTPSLPSYRAISSSEPLTTSDFTVECTVSLINATLPSAVGIAGQEFQVKNSSAGDITLLPNGAETIDGLASITVLSGQSYKVTSNGTNFIIT